VGLCAKISEERTRKESLIPSLKKRAGIWRPFQGKDRNSRGWLRCRAVERGDGLCCTAKTGKCWRWSKPRKTVVDVRLAEAQLTHYVTEIERHQSFRPLVFWQMDWKSIRGMWDTAPSAKCLVSSPAMIGKPALLAPECKAASSVEINNHIVDRFLPHEAIRRVGEAFAQRQAKALIVMATGTSRRAAKSALLIPVGYFFSPSQIMHKK